MKQTIRGSSATRLQNDKQWRARVILALAICVAAFLGCSYSLAGFVVRFDPALAHRLAPGNGIVSSAYAQSLFSQNPNPSGGAEAARLARDALIAEPAAVDALTVLAFQSELRGQTEARDAILGYATKLSRRELRPQIWAIENAVSEGDIAGALRHYDTALTTAGEARAILFPPLSFALSEPLVRRELIRVMKSGPPWAEGFLSYASTVGGDAEAIADFFAQSVAAGNPVDRSYRANVVNTLYSRQDFEVAWRHYAKFRPNVDRRQSRDPMFQLTDPVSTEFDWVSSTDDGVTASLLPARSGGRLDFAVSPDTSVNVMRQAQMLPPGRYRLTGRSAGIEQPSQSRPYWALACQNGRELGRVDVPNSSQANGRFEGFFAVAGCPVQVLYLAARHSSELGGVTGQILHARLEPAD